jgi:hypothetical protein
LKDDFLVYTDYISPKSAAFKISASTDYSSFIYSIGRPTDRKAFENGTLAGTVMKEDIYSLTYNAFDLQPDTEYAFFVRGTDRAGVQTKVFQINFTIPKAEEVPFGEFSVNYIDQYAGEYLVTPNAKCGKLLFFISDEGKMDNIMFGDMNYAGDLIRCLTDWERTNFNGVIVAENAELKATNFTTGLLADTPLDVYVMSYDAEGVPANVIKYSVSTPAYDASLPEANVGVTISAITAKGATYNFKADDNTLGFLYETIEADWYDGAVSDGTMDAEKLRNQLFTKGFWKYCAGPLDYSWVEETAEASKRYYAAVCPINFNGVSDPEWGKVVLTPFTTLTE